VRRSTDVGDAVERAEGLGRDAETRRRLTDDPSLFNRLANLSGCGASPERFSRRSAALIARPGGGEKGVVCRFVTHPAPPAVVCGGDAI
jgi:hypothetical protein